MLVLDALICLVLVLILQDTADWLVTLLQEPLDSVSTDFHLASQPDRYQGHWHHREPGWNSTSGTTKYCQILSLVSNFLGCFHWSRVESLEQFSAWHWAKSPSRSTHSILVGKRWSGLCTHRQMGVKGKHGYEKTLITCRSQCKMKIQWLFFKNYWEFQDGC
jgi:hypothetical protein